MTGFGRCRKEFANFTITCEVRSVNHRFCEFHFRMPRELLRLEEKLKKKMSKYVHRGRMDVFITIEGEGFLTPKIHIHWGLLDEYYRSLLQIQEKYGLENHLTLQDLLNREEFITFLEEDEENEELERIILDTVEQATIQLQQMRLTEGEALKKDLLVQLEKIEKKVHHLKRYAPEVVQQYAGRLRKRMEEFSNGQLDEIRLINEVAIFADKADINEELTRLISHIAQFKQILNEDRPIGRKLDFLLQEMNREINTIGSKANDSKIAVEVVEMKSLLEKMKEQVQNVE